MDIFWNHTFMFWKILANFSYLKNSRGNKVNVCMYVWVFVCVTGQI